MKIFEMKTLIMLAFIFYSGLAFSQQYLYIKKPGEIPKERIGLNERIHIKIKNHDEWISGILKEIKGNSIKVNDRLFYFSNLEGIRTYNSFVKTLGTGLWAGGTLFSSIAIVNNLINDERPLLTNGQIVWGAGFGALGVIVSRLSRKTYWLDKGYKFEIIDLDE